MSLLKQHLLKKESAFLLLLLLSFKAFSSEQKNTISSTQAVPSFYIWQDLRQVIDGDVIFKSQQNQALVQKMSFSYEIIKLLLNQSFFQDYFFSKIQKEYSQPNPEIQIQTVHVVSDLLQVLHEGTPQQIKKFMSDHNFTKAEKIIALIPLIFTNRLGEKVLDLMDSLGLSVNETLKIKDISASLAKRGMVNADDVITVLSHHLINTGDLSLLNQLSDAKYDTSIKNLMNENILHAFIRLNIYRDLYRQPPLTNYQEFLETLAEYSQPIINEKEILGFTPLAEAVSLNDQTAVEVLINKESDLTTRDIFDRSLEDLAALQNNSQLLLYLKENTPVKQETEKSPVSTVPNTKKQNHKDVTTLNFQLFLKLLVNSMILEDTIQHPSEIQEAIYSSLLQNLHFLETLRLDALSTVFYSGQLKDSAEIAQIFSAISKKDSHFFTNMSDDQEQQLAIFLKQSQNGEALAITNFLLEAIRSSFLTAVQFISKKYKSFPFVQNEVSFNSIDPLSLSLITYASLDNKHPLKSEAKTIVRFVADHIYSEESSSLFVKTFPPITWAIFLGLLDEVKFLHEEKGMELTNAITSEDQSWLINSIYYTQKTGFLKLNKYLQEQLLFSECHGSLYN